MFKISKGLLIIAAISFIAIGATRSYFTDTETISDNHVAFGTLDMTISEGDSLIPITLDNLKPGDIFEKTITINNAGSIDFGSLKLSLANADDPNGLLSQLDVDIKGFINSDPNQPLAIIPTMKVDQISGIELIDTSSNYLQSGNNADVTITLSVPTDLGNDYQSLGASFNLIFDAEQVK